MNRRLSTILAAALLLASCGGTGVPIGGIQGSGTTVASGPITGFGSIFVNGVEYATTSAQISIDGQSGMESQLHVGQIVTVNGTVNADRKTGTATQVTFIGDVAGPVTQLNVTARTFVILGQTVRVSGSTLFDGTIQPASLAGLQNGSIVEVSGFPNAAGEIVASRIQLQATGSALEARGLVQSLDTVAHTFRLNTLTVDYTGVVPTNGTLANGSNVKVSGTNFTTAGALLATRVDVLKGFGGAANSTAELDAIITTFASNTDFVINGQHVTTNANTQFVLNGATLGVNVRVEVEGSLNASGVLVATKVEAKANTASLVRGLVDSVTAASNTLSVLGVTITVTAATELDDESSQHMRPFKLSDLRTGDYVDIRGSAAQTGGLTAGVLVRERPDTLSDLQGTATNVMAPSLTVLGAMVTTNAQTQFLDANGATVTAAAFFSQAPNNIVKIRGNSLLIGGFGASVAQIAPAQQGGGQGQ